MPVRIPNARASEVFCFGAAGVGTLAPLYMMKIRARKEMRSKRKPRRQSGRGINRVKPPIERTVQRIEQRLPLERFAKNVDSKIKRSIDRWQPKPPPAQ
ncbi:hypothetical protein MAPG_01497 [Magnaporthiopsis poae ATCC 64411]|uniref:Transmembrane protein n=1 Tax=Magnaporthiopsis poae (strain ATCC 64411 / 73-15) TaxID=644358 RepID=A0A0C4DNV0_MAGP6|nr:hypothetical protein MAPG_01497 [Magnaporthiopsis poae ATCC 64411]